MQDAEPEQAIEDPLLHSLRIQEQWSVGSRGAPLVRGHAVVDEVADARFVFGAVGFSRE